MTKKSPDTVQVTPEMLAEAIAWMTPERLAALDAMTNEDIPRKSPATPTPRPS